MTGLPRQSNGTPAAGACTCPGGTVPVYREYHEPECPLATSYDRRAAVEMSGMSREEIAAVGGRYE